MLPDDKKHQILARFSEMEDCLVPVEGGKSQKPIRDVARKAEADRLELEKRTDPVMPILGTALVINWPEVAAARRTARFQGMFPEISTLAEFKRVLDATDPVDFCRTYLDIKATDAGNPKYCLLKGLVEAFLDYQRAHGFPSEIEAIRHWAATVEVERLKSDPIGKVHGVGPGVVGNIRLNLGMDAIKPNRHVIGVMKKFLMLDIPYQSLEAVAAWLGVGKKYFDEVLFRYGQAKQISA